MMQTTQQRGSTRTSPLTVALCLLGTLLLLLGQSPLQPVQRGWRVSHQVLQLSAERDRLRLENRLLDEYGAASKTPAGEEMLARGRYGMVCKNEWVVSLADAPTPPAPKTHGLAAVMDRMRERANEGLQSWRALDKLIQSERRDKTFE